MPRVTRSSSPAFVISGDLFIFPFYIRGLKIIIPIGIIVAYSYDTGDLFVEPVGKVLSKHFVGDAQKSGFVHGTTINDLMIGKGKVTP